MTDFWLGAVWTLACVFAGVLITLLVVAIFGDDPGEGPDDEPPSDPTPQELEAWLEEHTLTEFPEVDLRR